MANKKKTSNTVRYLPTQFMSRQTNFAKPTTLGRSLSYAVVIAKPFAVFAKTSSVRSSYLLKS